MISVLCATRKRKEALKKSLNSLVATAGNPADIELLLAFDNDDVDTAVATLRDFPNAKVLITPRYGYRELQKYYNYLSAIADGEWLFLWNDDAIMETHGWEKLVDKYNGKMVALRCMFKNGNNPEINNRDVLFPIIPRKFYELTGHFSDNRHNDTYLSWIFNTLERCFLLDIVVRHERADFMDYKVNNDSTFAEREYITQLRICRPFRRGVNRDLDILKKYIEQNPGV